MSDKLSAERIKELREIQCECGLTSAEAEPLFKAAEVLAEVRQMYAAGHLVPIGPGESRKASKLMGGVK